jgi:hypothetical protein
MSKQSIDPKDIESYDDDREETERDRDGVGSLRDIEAESGDEDGTSDDFDLDQVEAHELGVDLDRVGGETPLLD